MNFCLLISLLSFILDGTFSLLFPINSLFLPLLSLMALIIIYPYLVKKEKEYLVICFTMGMFYDIIYTNTIMLNALLFIIVGLIIIAFDYILSTNFLNTILLSLIVILFYRFLSYLPFVIMTNASFSFIKLLTSIYTSLILNLIYITIVYVIALKISKRFKIKRRV